MDRAVAVALTVAVGCLIALQAPINSGLGRALGTFQAAFVSFAIGTTLLLVIAVVVGGGLGDIVEIRHVSGWYLLGGVLGAAYVTCVLVTVRTLGAGGVTAATITGQLTMAMLIDQFGWLGVHPRPITAAKLAGLVLLAAGVTLIVRD